MMFKTLTTLFKAQSFQMEEALIDANSAAILSQKINEAEAGHAEAKRMLATMIAQEKTDTKLLNAVEVRVNSMIEAATKAMQAGSEELAADAAVQIAELENEKMGREKSLAELRDRIARLRHTIEKAQRKLIDLRQRATQAKQAQREGKARAKLGKSIGGYGSLSEAEGIAERIDSLPDQVEAWDAFDELDSQLSGKSVEQRLADEGHGDNKRATAASVLERLKTQATENQ